MSAFAKLEQALRESQEAAEQVRRERDAASGSLGQTRSALEQADAALQQARTTIEQSSAQLLAVHASRSWRVTAPLRYCESVLRTWFRGRPRAEAVQQDAAQPQADRTMEDAPPASVSVSVAPAAAAGNALSAEARAVRRDLERMAEQRKW